MGLIQNRMDKLEDELRSLRITSRKTKMAVTRDAMMFIGVGLSNDLDNGMVVFDKGFHSEHADTEILKGSAQPRSTEMTTSLWCGHTHWPAFCWCSTRDMRR